MSESYVKILVRPNDMGERGVLHVSVNMQDYKIPIGVPTTVPIEVANALKAANDSSEYTEPYTIYEEGDVDFDEEGNVVYIPQTVTARIASLDGTPIAAGNVVEAMGAPVYVDDVSTYSAYGITDKGWYLFARVTGRPGTAVTVATAITGAAGYIAAIGADHVDLAVRFGVTAASQLVTIDWGTYEDQLVFKATDLAVRNLDYRTTFYLYDLAPFVTWTYALTTDAAFVATKDYYTLADGVYTKTAESVKYALTEDATFASGKTYYTLADGVYSAATVTADEAVPADTYYELAAVPADTYYTHSKVTFAGMTRNVTYKFDEIIDCPIEIALPEVEDDGYGAWFEIQLRYNGSYSCTLLPPTGVKIGTVSTQSQTAGINVLDLQYTGVGGVAMWSLLNTHSNIPT